MTTSTLVSSCAIFTSPLVSGEGISFLSSLASAVMMGDLALRPVLVVVVVRLFRVLVVPPTLLAGPVVVVVLEARGLCVGAVVARDAVVPAVFLVSVEVRLESILLVEFLTSLSAVAAVLAAVLGAGPGYSGLRV